MRVLRPVLLTAVLAAGWIAAPAAIANIYGDDDRLARPARDFSAEEQAAYSGIGRIRCKRPNGRFTTATMFLLGDRSTAVTNAHAFRDLDDRAVRLDPAGCRFLLARHDGSTRERLPLAEVRSRWDEAAFDRDMSHDFALVRLARPARAALPLPGVRIGHALGDGEPVCLAAFHGGFGKNERKLLRRSCGRAWPLPADAASIVEALDRGLRVRNRERLAAADFDSSVGSSGGPVFDAAGNVIGVNRGAHGAFAGAAFSLRRNHNIFLTFDERFARDWRDLAGR